MNELDALLAAPGRVLLSGVPEGHDALVLSQIARRDEAAAGLLHIAADDARLARMADALAFFAPDATLLRLPAWDCLPYDRVSPNGSVVAERIDALTRLATWSAPRRPIVLTTVSAVLQRVPPRATLAGASFHAAAGEQLDLDALKAFLVQNGYGRAETVREPGEFALRGGIVDLFPPGSEEPLRLDLFGDELERIRRFDPVSQRTTGEAERLSLEPVSEAFLDPDSIARFRAGYRERFGSVADDPLYAAVSEGRRPLGMEHWLPLFHERLETVLDFVPGAIVALDPAFDEARRSRLEMIADYYRARLDFLEARAGRAAPGQEAAPPYRPLPPDLLYLTGESLERALAERAMLQLSPLVAGEAPAGARAALDLGGRRAPDLAAVRARARASAGAEAEANVFDRVRDYVEAERARGRRVLIAAFTAGTRERLAQLLADHGIAGIAPAETWPDALALPEGTIAAVVLPLDRGFTTADIAVVGEQDILGERLVRAARRRRRAESFVADVTELAPGDYVVHVDHGIGRYEGLETLTVSGAPHDCLRVTYAGDDRLYVPVENVEVLSRYGSADSAAALDRLGGAAWQSRKARIKKRLRDMAEALIKVAAQRAVKEADRLAAPEGSLEEFSARFPYDETEDQSTAIDDTLADLVSGRPMDRLICGDVGFGKTEVALRAAFAAVSSGGQVAVVVPTTLLCRQHYQTFTERFAGLGVWIEQLSRLVPAKQAAETRERLARGEIDIVIGTHALLSKSVRIKNLALLVVDEEQRFGVAHKERLKQLKADVHVLSLSATPIPRTLQMALSGVKDLSVIATPPVDRLAVRTFVTPFDPVVLREAIMREHFRGGQSFYVCPRIEDLEPVAERLRTLVPEIRFGIAHGRMPGRALEQAMNAFYDGATELLLCTQIVESGLDIPTANTLIVHRADRFGLAQLYQLRGRIGRAKLRAYCYLTVPPDRVLTEGATKRLEVLQALDSLGAGFTLASHDLDIRGAGNLLGEEQSGHIREVGVELYQHMLEEAVAAARGVEPAEEEWTPQINLDMPVLIPEDYVADLGVRLGLYRRIAALEDERESEAFAAELIDRFGSLPSEVETLLKVVAIKRLCRQARVEKLDTGPKGAVVTFRDDRFPNPAGLVDLITRESGRTRLRPDNKLVFHRDWEGRAQRLAGAERLMRSLAGLAVAAEAAE